MATCAALRQTASGATGAAVGAGLAVPGTPPAAPHRRHLHLHLHLHLRVEPPGVSDPACSTAAAPPRRLPASPSHLQTCSEPRLVPDGARHVADALAEPHAALLPPPLAARRLRAGPVGPDVDAGNKNTGGDKLQATNLYFVNGGMDPWRHVSVTARPTGDAVAAGVMECEGCGRAFDLKASAETPAAGLHGEAEIRSHLASWIGGGTPQQQSAQLKFSAERSFAAARIVARRVGTGTTAISPPRAAVQHTALAPPPVRPATSSTSSARQHLSLRARRRRRAEAGPTATAAPAAASSIAICLFKKVAHHLRELAEVKSTRGGRLRRACTAARTFSRARLHP